MTMNNSPYLKLCRLYPNMDTGLIANAVRTGSDIQIPSGWVDLVNACHGDLLNVAPDYQVLAIKMKYAWLRYYIQSGLPDDNSFNPAAEIISLAERMSQCICHDCGNNGRSCYAPNVLPATPSMPKSALSSVALVTMILCEDCFNNRNNSRL